MFQTETDFLMIFGCLKKSGQPRRDPVAPLSSDRSDVCLHTERDGCHSRL
jgi:hypothetical protein